MLSMFELSTAQVGLGYCWALLRRVRRPISRELMAFHRQEQLTKLRAIFTSLLRFKRVDSFNGQRQSL